MDFQFGDNSFARHCAAANAQGIPLAYYDSDTVTFDLDVPSDLPGTPSPSSKQ
jgi:2-phospho-L-lactate guanylyltransferase (CobY/MobA/RfbA family)